MNAETPDLPEPELPPRPTEHLETEPMAVAIEPEARGRGGIILALTALLVAGLVAVLMLNQINDGGDSVALDSAASGQDLVIDEAPAAESLPSIEPTSSQPADDSNEADNEADDSAAVTGPEATDTEPLDTDGAEADDASEVDATEAPLACVLPMVAVDGECQEFTLSFAAATEVPAEPVVTTRPAAAPAPTAKPAPEAKPTATPVATRPPVSAPEDPPASEEPVGWEDGGDADNSVEAPNVQCVRAPCCLIAPGAADEPAVWCDNKLCDPTDPHDGCTTLELPPVNVPAPVPDAPGTPTCQAAHPSCFPCLLEDPFCLLDCNSLADCDLGEVPAPGECPEGTFIGVGLPCEVPLPPDVIVCEAGHSITNAGECLPVVDYPLPVEPTPGGIDCGPHQGPNGLLITPAHPDCAPSGEPEPAPCAADDIYCGVDCNLVDPSPGSPLIDYCGLNIAPTPPPPGISCPGPNGSVIHLAVGETECPIVSEPPLIPCPGSGVATTIMVEDPSECLTLPPPPPTPQPTLQPEPPLPPTPVPMQDCGQGIVIPASDPCPPPREDPPPPAGCPAGTVWDGGGCALAADPFCWVTLDDAGSPIVREDNGEFLMMCA